MRTDLELLKQFIDYHGEIWGNLDGIFIPFLRAYFLLTGRQVYPDDSIQVRDIEYEKTWDSHSECAYVSISRGHGHNENYYISVWHHEGAYMVFDGRIAGLGTEAEDEAVRCDAGENGCILEFQYADGLYDFLAEIKKWIIYKGIRDDLGLEGYDNFDRIFKGFVAFKESLAAIEDSEE